MSKVSILKPSDRTILAAIVQLSIEAHDLRVWRLSYWSTLFNVQAVREPCSATIIQNGHGAIMTKLFRPGVSLETQWDRMTAEDLAAFLGLEQLDAEWQRDEHEEEVIQRHQAQAEAEQRRRQLTGK